MLVITRWLWCNDLGKLQVSHFEMIPSSPWLPRHWWGAHLLSGCNQSGWGPVVALHVNRLHQVTMVGCYSLWCFHYLSTGYVLVTSWSWALSYPLSYHENLISENCLRDYWFLSQQCFNQPIFFSQPYRCQRWNRGFHSPNNLGITIRQGESGRVSSAA